jgi:hypothetical protein
MIPYNLILKKKSSLILLLFCLVVLIISCKIPLISNVNNGCFLQDSTEIQIRIGESIYFGNSTNKVVKNIMELGLFKNLNTINSHIESFVAENNSCDILLVIQDNDGYLNHVTLYRIVEEQSLMYFECETSTKYIKAVKKILLTEIEKNDLNKMVKLIPSKRYLQDCIGFDDGSTTTFFLNKKGINHFAIGHLVGDYSELNNQDKDKIAGYIQLRHFIKKLHTKYSK